MYSARMLVILAALVALVATGCGGSNAASTSTTMPNEDVLSVGATPPASDFLVDSGPMTTLTRVESVPPSVPQDGRLDDLYEQCVKAAGFDPGGVQVLLDESKRPWWVKTGRDVPAEFHRPCFRAVGGDDPFNSSHGLNVDTGIFDN